MWLFIMSDAITFAALLMAYCYVRVASDNWPTPFEFYPGLVKATVMTFILLSSSVTMVMAVRAAKLEKRAARSNGSWRPWRPGSPSSSSTPPSGRA